MINNTHNYLKHYLRFLVLCVLACWKTQVAFSQSYELFVGETYTLPEPTPPAGYVDHTGTGRCTNKSDCISVSGLQIKVRKYFTGTATIEVDYNYTWTYNGKRQVSNATAYYSVSCKPTEVKLNKTSIELGIGGEFDLSYTTTPSNLEPEVEWRTSDKKIASLDYSNETVADQKEVVVYGESEGTCTIRLVCNTGYPAPECKVTVVDNYWVKADVKGNVKKGTKVTLTSIKAGAVIYYTTDGTEPTKSSTRYTSPIQINEDLTIKAKAFLGNQESKTSTFNYTVVSHLDGEQFMAKTKEGVDMSFIAKSGALEVSSGSKYKPAIDKDYSGFITIPNKVDDMRVKYISERAFYGCNITGVAFEEITSVSVKVIQAEAFRDCKNLKSVTFPHGIGLREMSFYNCESLETIAFEGWAQYYYKDTKEIFNNCNKIKDIFLYRIKTIDAIRDDCFSNQTYDEATLHVPEKLISNYKLLSGWKKFKNIVAIESEQNEKLLLSASPSGGKVPVGTKVTLTAKANGSTVSADIYYTTNGTTPTKNSTKYSSSGITINEACTLKAIAYKDGYETSDVLTETYTTKSNPKLTLSASPSGGSVKSGTIVYLTTSADGSTVSGADIYYTTNGTTPTKNSTKYTSSGISIMQACTLNAIAYKDGYETSEVLTEDFSVEIEAENISLPSEKVIKIGESFTMTYTLTPSNATTTLTWSSDDTSIATVSSSGVVKGIKAGTTKIRVKTSNGKTDYCSVTVENNTVEPTSISLPSSKTVKVGESFTMTYTLIPSNATTTLTWTSDDSSVATVSSSGVVKGVKAGTTKIRVKTANGKTDYCNVTVEDDKPKEFTAKTQEGVEMKFQVISENEKTCQVGNGSLAISDSDSYSGNITIPTKVNGYSVIAIGEGAFHSSKISSIVIPNSIQKISGWALYNCRSLNSIAIPKSVIEIENRAFSKSAIKTITVDDGNPLFDSRNSCNAIIKTSTNEIVVGCSETIIPSSVKGIGEYAFEQCIDLYKIDIPLSVEKIGKAAFSYSGLTEAVIPNSVKSIGWHAFSWCDNLLHITIGSAVRTIDEHAFIANESLITVTSFIDNPFEIDTNVFQLFSLDIDNKPSNATLYVPKGKKSKYMSTAGWNMFRRIVEENDKNGKTFKGYSTEGVEMTFRVISESDKICQVGDNPYAGTDGSIYGRRAVSYNTSGNITIPSNVNGYKVVKIADLAFINCPDITSVEMPNTITDIGGYAFQKCSGLTSFSLPSSVEIIGKYAISMCSGLRKVTLPEGLVSVEDGLFWKDESLLTFNLPSTLKEIGYSVFIGCNSLTDIYSYMQTPCDYYPSSIFEDDAYNNATLFVPNGTKAAYTRLDYWYKFKNIVEFDPSGINDILMDNTKDLHIYDLNGHKLLTPQRGINIINGKKVFVK